MSRGVRWLLVLAGLVAAGLFAGRTADRWHPSRQDYPAQGFALSAEEAEVEWAAAAEQADFVYLPATDGVSGAADRFLRTAAQARDAGLSVGAIHRFDLCLPAREQAVNLLAHLPREAADLPLAVELTDASCGGRPPAPAAAVERLSSFLALAEAGGRPPAILRIAPALDALSNRIERPHWLTRRYRQPDTDWELWTANPDRVVAGVAAPVEWIVARPPPVTGGP